MKPIKSSAMRRKRPNMTLIEKAIMVLLDSEDNDDSDELILVDFDEVRDDLISEVLISVI